MVHRHGYRTPLHFAVRGDLAKAKCYIKQGAKLHARDDENGGTPLAAAAKVGKLEMVEFLLDAGTKPNLPDDPPWATPLAWATRRGHVAVAEALQKRGAQ